MDKYLYWLDRVEGLGNLTKRNLLEAFGSAREVYLGQDRYLKYVLDEKKLGLIRKAQRELEVEAAWEKAAGEGIKMVCCFEPGFPEKLIAIPDVPFCIYYKGMLPDEKLPSVAVIGARECSQYGEYVANELGKALGEQGVQVISGMAKGIDGISQMAALEAGGRSFGVLGCGVDICYPKSNRSLYEKLQSTGGILSTYPPGTQPQAKFFPPRNRIVSGLADVLVVIEARQKSGTYITVEMALEQGKEIYAVPGRVTDRLSDGCNKMLKEGAHVFLSPQDFLLDLQELLPFAMNALRKKQCAEVFSKSGQVREALYEMREEGQALTAREDNTDKCDAQGNIQVGDKTAKEDTLMQALLEILDFYPQPIEKIALQLKEKYKIEQRQEDLTTKLMYMCLYGLAKQESVGWFSGIINKSLFEIVFPLNNNV